MAQLPKFRKSTNLQQRILSALILLPLSLYLLYIGPPASLIFVGLIGLFVFFEWFLLCKKLQMHIISQVFFFLLGLAYLGIGSYWFYLSLSQEEGWKLVFWLLFLVWATDILAYVGGVLLKGPKWIPSISPKKTWSGFISGMIGGSAIAYVSALWLVPGVFSILGIVALVLIAQLGDVLESIFKRKAGIKDSSPFIPGHGGFLDRLDSLFAVCFSLAAWHYIFQ